MRKPNPKRLRYASASNSTVLGFLSNQFGLALGCSGVMVLPVIASL